MRKTVILFAAIFLLFAIPALWLNTQTGIYVWGEFLVCKDPATYGGVTLTREDDVTRFTGQAVGNDFTAELRWNGSHAAITFPDGQTISGHWDGTDYLRTEDGPPWSSSWARSASVSTVKPCPWTPAPRPTSCAKWTGTSRSIAAPSGWCCWGC